MQEHAERADNNSRESAKELSALGTAKTEAVVVDLCLHAWVAMYGLLCMGCYACGSRHRGNWRQCVKLESTFCGKVLKEAVYSAVQG